MINQSNYTQSGNLFEVAQKKKKRAYRLLQLVDGAINRSLKNKDPLEKFLFDLKRYCIVNEMKEMSAAFQTEQTEPGLIYLTESIQLEPGTLIVVDSRLGWNIDYNDLYYVEKVLEDGYLVRDNGEGKAWKYTYEKFWRIIFSRQEIGANAYIMSPAHPEYWTAKNRLGFKPAHQKKEISRVAVEPRKVVREIVDWRDMLTNQEHLIFDNGQQQLIPVGLEGSINGIVIDEIENTDFLKARDVDYPKIFANTIFVFQGNQDSMVMMSYEELLNYRWVQIEMGY